MNALKFSHFVLSC